MKSRLTRQLMCLRAARELKDGEYVNIGIGAPAQVSCFIPPEMDVVLEVENGVLNHGPIIDDWDKYDVDLINAGGQPLSLKPGISFFDVAVSFAMIRRGHLDTTIVGAYQVSEKGDLANWKTPDQPVGAIGGAMDLAYGAKRVIVVMEHTDRNGRPKLVKECSYPLTAKGVVSIIITDMAVIDITPEGPELREVAPGFTTEEIQAVTEPRLIISKQLKEIEF